MTANRLDIVVFGASGYTGKFVVRELARVGASYPGLRWAVAGRSQEKLEALIHSVAKLTEMDLSSVSIITASVEDESSLRAMCSQAKVLVNCCGPFMKLGEPVVAAAVQCETHYVDVSGEERFVELLEQKYAEAARGARVLVVPTCGLSSVPADLGVVHLQKHFGGTLNSVESYLLMHFPPKMLKEKTEGFVRYSSWESMINSMASVSLRKILQPSSPMFEPVLRPRYLIHRNLNRWCLPLPGTDEEIVNRTQRHLSSLEQKRPVQYKQYITFPSLITTLMVLISGALLFMLSKITCTRKLLLNYARRCTFGMVTFDHPKEGIMDGMTLQYEMIGEGWENDDDVGKTPPNRKAVGRVSVSGAEPAYAASAVVVIFSALAILQESDKIPDTYGVLTPGVAFRNTSLIKNLHENNVKFDIVTNV